uniref:serine/threonine-protein kinase NIM1 isoform X3 n=1 Tax=Ciona intestinalis TaxID=7719 RepID=UPI00006A510E|nr:serine/threonine-protein kinase NIM1 isoform X3 [Ciona intestinalis]|eukprot:XP_009858540.1 serine/threonine-protein kinase NIM1 isoform X3 [Ciona intestinalis]
MHDTQFTTREESKRKPSIHSADVVKHVTSPYQKLRHSCESSNKNHWEISLGKRIGFYTLRGELGSGNFSRVKAGIHLLTKERVAIKILDKQKMDKKTKLLLSREISNLEALHHPHIIHLYEVIHTEKKLFLVMEYASGGELYTKLSTQGKLSEPDSKIVFSQILSAVQHMHQHNVIHRDLKAENIFYSEKKHIKVGDFGFSTTAKSLGEALNTFCGSPPYAAPELFKEAFYYGESVDIWALGIILYFAVTGLMPFRAETVGKLKKRIISGHFNIPNYLSNECKELIQAILKPVSSERISVSEIKKCAWLTEVEYPAPMNRYRLQPENVVLTTALPQEVHALQMMGKLGINENELKRIKWNNKGDELELSGKQGNPLLSEPSTVSVSLLNEYNAMVGTYRILLMRAHKKFLSRLPVKQELYLCASCQKFNVARADCPEEKVVLHKEDNVMWKIQQNNNNQKPIKPTQNPSTVKSKFCLIL